MNNKSYWLKFKPTKNNSQLFVDVVSYTQAKVCCYKNGKHQKWSIEFPFSDEINEFKKMSVFEINEMPMAVIK